MSAHLPPRNDIICSEVWGGIEAVETTIAVPGMVGVLCACPGGGHAGGDVYYTTACDGGLLARICLADLTGHGEAVTEVSRWFHDTLRAQINRYDPSIILDTVNHIAVDRGLEAMATAACFSYFRKACELRYSYAGHPHAFLYRVPAGRWEPLTLPKPTEGPANVVLGVTKDCRYEVGVAHMDTGDRLFIFSDGVTETRDKTGAQFGDERLRSLLDANASTRLEDLPRAVMEALRAFAGRDTLDHDDITTMCFEAGPPMDAPFPHYVVRSQIRKRMRDRRIRQTSTQEDSS